MIRWTGEAAAGVPYWWAGDSPCAEPAAAPAQTDILIIGAGYTGLSAAIAAHDAGAGVVVVDAGVPGHGASTRNGGMFGAHPRLRWERLAKDYGAETADAILAEAAPALAFARDLIAREGIDCSLQDTGRLQLAWTRAHHRAQRQLAARIREKSDVRVEIVTRDDLPREIATERYFGGLLFPDHGAIQPRRFHDGLLSAVRRRGVPVVPRWPVAALGREGGGHVARGSQGAIRAEKVILATNGYTAEHAAVAFRWHGARVFALPSFLIATEALPAGLVAELAPGGRMMVETRARHSYFRASPDGRRILFGGRAAMRDIPLALAARRLHATMAEIWPALSDVALSHVWCGNTGYSFGHMPSVGGADGLYHAMGYSGSGTVMAPWLGAQAAWMATDDPRAGTAHARIGLRRSWLHPVAKPWFLHAADRWYRLVVDPLESRAGR